MKIIIVGCGKVGTTLAEQLNRENHDITLIDTDDEALKNISDNVDLMSVTGNGAIYQVQMEAGIQEADLILVMKDGNIIEQGRHEELLAKKGFLMIQTFGTKWIFLYITWWLTTHFIITSTQSIFLKNTSR